MSRSCAYITTPIYYVNDRPHIGHVYSTTISDVWARYQRLAGRDVFFLTGTDEHATKVVDAATERGLTAQQWADQNAKAFREIFAELQLTNDDFIRTSEQRHKQKVTEYVGALLESGDVYLGEYSGWYDAGQEEYVPENKAKEHEFKSPINGRPLVRKTEHNYFFRLSSYRDALTEYVAAHPGFVLPDARRNEILNRIADADDVPISRTGMTDWGIRVPGDEAHTIYVWIDALFNYLSTVDTPQRRKYWLSGPVHVLAKDILWFHAAIWPAMLMALRKCAGYEWVAMPHMVYAHSFYISEGQKMSKTLGNFLDIEAIRGYVSRYSLDALRYYLTTQGPLGATDANFRAEHFHEVYENDLVNTFGNSSSRVTAMINKYFDGLAPGETVAGERLTVAGYDWPAACAEAADRCAAAMERFDLMNAIAAGFGLVRQVDVFINATEPFRIAKDPDRRNELGAILYQCLEALRIASVLTWCVIPGKVAEFWQAIGVDIDPGQGGLDQLVQWGGISPGAAVKKVALFPRVEAEPATA